jgi:hypothetical protein
LVNVASCRSHSKVVANDINLSVIDVVCDQLRSSRDVAAGDA